MLSRLFLHHFRQPPILIKETVWWVGLCHRHSSRRVWLILFFMKLLRIALVLFRFWGKSLTLIVVWFCTWFCFYFYFIYEIIHFLVFYLRIFLLWFELLFILLRLFFLILFFSFLFFLLLYIILLVGVLYNYILIFYVFLWCREAGGLNSSNDYILSFV